MSASSFIYAFMVPLFFGLVNVISYLPFLVPFTVSGHNPCSTLTLFFSNSSCVFSFIVLVLSNSLIITALFIFQILFSMFLSSSFFPSCQACSDFTILYRTHYCHFCSHCPCLSHYFSSLNL